MHDRLCGFEEVVWATGVRTVLRPCTCGLIAAVRADEREKAAQRVSELWPAAANMPFAVIDRSGAIRAAARGGEQDA